MDEPSNPPSSPGRRRIIEFSSSPPRDRSEVGQSDNLPAFEDETNILGRDVEDEDEVRNYIFLPKYLLDLPSAFRSNHVFCLHPKLV